MLTVSQNRRCRRVERFDRIRNGLSCTEQLVFLCWNLGLSRQAFWSACSRPLQRPIHCVSSSWCWQAPSKDISQQYAWLILIVLISCQIILVSFEVGEREEQTIRIHMVFIYILSPLAMLERKRGVDWCLQQQASMWNKGQDMYCLSNIFCWTARMFPLRRLVLKGMLQIACAKTGALLVKDASSVLIRPTIFFKTLPVPVNMKQSLLRNPLWLKRTSTTGQLSFVSFSLWQNFAELSFSEVSLPFQNLYLRSATYCFTSFLRVVRQFGFVIGSGACCGIWWLQYAGYKFHCRLDEQHVFEPTCLALLGCFDPLLRCNGGGSGGCGGSQWWPRQCFH